jgi:hypothetical protein
LSDKVNNVFPSDHFGLAATILLSKAGKKELVPAQANDDKKKN